MWVKKKSLLLCSNSFLPDFLSSLSTLANNCIQLIVGYSERTSLNVQYSRTLIYSLSTNKFSSVMLGVSTCFNPAVPEVGKG